MRKCSFLPGCMCTKCMPGASTGQSKALDLLKMEVQVVVSICVGYLVTKRI